MTERPVFARRIVLTKRIRLISCWDDFMHLRAIFCLQRYSERIHGAAGQMMSYGLLRVSQQLLLFGCRREKGRNHIHD
jgi:hypothetical protein